MLAETRSLLRGLFTVFLVGSLSLMVISSAAAASFTLDPPVLVSRRVLCGMHGRQRQAKAT
jgi:hypothetical protein